MFVLNITPGKSLHRPRTPQSFDSAIFASATQLRVGAREHIESHCSAARRSAPGRAASVGSKSCSQRVPHTLHSNSSRRASSIDRCRALKNRTRTCTSSECASDPAPLTSSNWHLPHTIGLDLGMFDVGRQVSAQRVKPA